MIIALVEIAVYYFAQLFESKFNESALKFNESALKNLLLNLTNLPQKI